MESAGKRGAEELACEQKTNGSIVWKWFGYKVSDELQNQVLCRECFKSVTTKGSSAQSAQKCVQWRKILSCLDFFFFYSRFIRFYKRDETDILRRKKIEFEISIMGYCPISRESEPIKLRHIRGFTCTYIYLIFKFSNFLSKATLIKTELL